MKKYADRLTVMVPILFLWGRIANFAFLNIGDVPLILSVKSAVFATIILLILHRLFMVLLKKDFVVSSLAVSAFLIIQFMFHKYHDIQNYLFRQNIDIVFEILIFLTFSFIVIYMFKRIKILPDGFVRVLLTSSLTFFVLAVAPGFIHLVRDNQRNTTIPNVGCEA